MLLKCEKVTLCSLVKHHDNRCQLNIKEKSKMNSQQSNKSAFNEVPFDITLLR